MSYLHTVSHHLSPYPPKRVGIRTDIILPDMNACTPDTSLPTITREITGCVPSSRKSVV